MKIPANCYSQNTIHWINYAQHADTETEVRMREVGAEIRRLREERGWTGAQLAVYAGMAPSAVSQIETGRRNPNTGSLAKIAKALEVEVVDLFPKAQSPLPLDSPQGASLEGFEGAIKRHYMEIVRTQGSEPNLLSKAQEAARRDEEKTSQAVNRLIASEGVLDTTEITEFEEDEFRTELRALGFPDEYFESFIWPLVVKAVRADQLDRELVQLRGEAAELRSRLAEAKAI